MTYYFEAIGQLRAVEMAYKLGHKTRRAIAEFTGIALHCVDSCLVWLRKANFDVEIASKLRSQASSESRKRNR